MGTTDDDDGAGSGVDSRQVLLVTLCLVGLVTAAFLAPVTGSNPTVGPGGGDFLTDTVADLLQFLFGDREPPDGGESQPPAGGGDGDGGGGDVPEWLVDIFRNLFGDSGGSGGGETDCQVYVGSNPTPGRETTVQVVDDEGPQSGVRVWFNDRYVGETNDEGVVAGEVPYVDRLNVTVQSDGPCTFSRRPSVGVAAGGTGALGPRAVDSATAAVGAPLHAALVGASSSVVAGTLQASLAADSTAQTSPGDDGVNSSNEVAVAGDATIEIIGEPYPNETVELAVRAGGVPVPAANVSVDGERVGQTDKTGRYTLTLPDRDSVTVAVTRGSVSGQRTVDVWQLRVGFVPQLTVPGETVTATVTTPDGPVSDAAVSVDGRRLGATGETGRLDFAAPASLDGAVTAATTRQSTTVPLSNVYLFTAAASGLILVLSTVSTGVVGRRYGRRRANRVAVGWLAVALLFVGYAVWELPGLTGALAVLALGWLYRNRTAVRSGGISVAATAQRYLEQCQRFALAVVDALEGFVDVLGAYAARLLASFGSLPRSLSALSAVASAWLGSVPERFWAAVTGVSAGRAGVATAACLFVVVATALFGARGFVVSAALVAAGMAGWLVWERRWGTESEPTDVESSPEPTSADERGGARTLRRLWRRFAARVVPGNWRTRTPAEISRAAIDAGFPREPVERLTEAFRDVEYGGDAESDRLDAAWPAYEAIEDATEEADER